MPHALNENTIPRRTLMHPSHWLVALALIGCTDAPTALAPTQAGAGSTPSAIPSTAPVASTPAPTANAASSYEPPSGWSVVVRAGGNEKLQLFALDDGDALLSVTPAAGGAPRWAKLTGDAVSWLPELANGLPTNALDGEVLVAGRLPDRLWLASGSPCVVRQWDGATWTVRDGSATLNVCQQLTSWLPNAAIAAGETKDGLALAAYGKLPKTLPVASRAPKQLGDAACRPGPLSATYYHLRGFETGELVAVGGSESCNGISVLERWPSDSAKSLATNALVDPNTPLFAVIRSKDEVHIEGITFDQATQQQDHASVTFRFDKKGKVSTMTKLLGGTSQFEAWFADAPAKAGFVSADAVSGFRYDRFAFGRTGRDIFVFGQLLQEAQPVASLLLLNRTVKAPLTSP